MIWLAGQLLALHNSLLIDLHSILWKRKASLSSIFMFLNDEADAINKILGLRI